MSTIVKRSWRPAGGHVTEDCEWLVISNDIRGIASAIGQTKSDASIANYWFRPDRVDSLRLVHTPSNLFYIEASIGEGKPHEKLRNPLTKLDLTQLELISYGGTRVRVPIAFLVDTETTLHIVHDFWMDGHLSDACTWVNPLDVGWDSSEHWELDV